MANNLEVAGRQRTQMSGRGARLRSALELLNLVNPTDMNCILHLARFYMLYNMDLAELMSTIVKLQDVRKENTIHYYLIPYKILFLEKEEWSLVAVTNWRYHFYFFPTTWKNIFY